MFYSIAGQQLVGKIMKKYLVLASLALSAIIPGAAALAADMDLPPPPPPVEQLRPATYDWTGFYAGGFVGSACVDGNFISGANSFLNAGCGFKGGALAGYNHQIDEVVFGFEADIATTSNLVSNEQAAADFHYKFDAEGTLRARLGYAMDDTMFFVTAGGAYAMGNITDNFSTTKDMRTGNNWGYTVGAGVEHAVTDSMRFKLDYLYTHYFDSDYGNGCCNINGGPGNTHEVRLGAIWAF